MANQYDPQTPWQVCALRLRDRPRSHKFRAVAYCLPSQVSSSTESSAGHRVSIPKMDTANHGATAYRADRWVLGWVIMSDSLSLSQGRRIALPPCMNPPI